jgi:CRP/FNR family transcriptional regulator, cyclic AMP receptor protein
LPPEASKLVSGPSPAERSEVLELIRGWQWFAYMPDEAREWLADRALLKPIDKDRIVYVSGEPVSYVYAVISGVFRIYMSSPRGDEITLEEVVRGGWFPHYRPLENPSYYASCICQSDAVVACFPPMALVELSRRWNGYYKGLYHELTDRAVVTLGRIELLSLHTLNVRLAVYLLRMARLRGQAEPGGPVWIGAFESQSEVGARVGGTRQRVNRALTAWARKGIIELHKDGTRILDLKRLTAEAEKSGFDIDSYLSAWHGGWQGHK